MSTQHSWIARLVCALSIVIILFSFSGTRSVQAQEPLPPCDGRDCPVDSDVTGQATANLKYYTKVTQKGWYVADGVGLADLGYGTITSSLLPPGSKVTKAYLFWNVVGSKTEVGYNYAKGYINGHAITGALVGTSIVSPWYSNDGILKKAYAYRADVKAYVAPAGGGAYALTGFASGRTDGVDPWPLPLSQYGFPFIEGASLVVIYSNPNLPTATVNIYNGASYVPYGLNSHLTITGVNAVVPSGMAYTTLIGAEGVHTSTASTYFYENPLPTITWTGLDHNGHNVNYSNGNFWDTQTVDIHAMVDAPEPNFVFMANKSGWMGIWVAQVLAYSAGSQDTDGDSLPDGWELNGFDANGDSLADVPIDLLGANMFHKDLFVEADYMISFGNFLPPVANLNEIVTTFSQAPVANPDGVTGINIHIDTGGYDADGVYTAAYNLGGGNEIPWTLYVGTTSPDCSTYNWTGFQTLKDTHFNRARAPIFHYVIFASYLAPCLETTSGISRNGWPDSVFIKGAMDFIVTLGGWGGHGSGGDREGTFVHELGHNLGLRHGGNDHKNYKPNYLSVMNYFFQNTGLWRNGVWSHYDYSRFLLPTLSETALYEAKGLGPLTIPDAYATRWYCPDGSGKHWTATGALDWNCDLFPTATAVRVDLNHDGAFTSLGTQNNWASITFKGNGITGNAAAAAAGELSAQGPITTKWVDELKADQVPPAPPNWEGQP